MTTPTLNATETTVPERYDSLAEGLRAFADASRRLDEASAAFTEIFDRVQELKVRRDELIARREKLDLAWANAEVTQRELHALKQKYFDHERDRDAAFVRLQEAAVSGDEPGAINARQDMIRADAHTRDVIAQACETNRAVCEAAGFPLLARDFDLGELFHKLGELRASAARQAGAAKDAVTTAYIEYDEKDAAIHGARAQRDKVRDALQRTALSPIIPTHSPMCEEASS